MVEGVREFFRASQYRHFESDNFNIGTLGGCEHPDIGTTTTTIIIVNHRYCEQLLCTGDNKAPTSIIILKPHDRAFQDANRIPHPYALSEVHK